MPNDSTGNFSYSSSSDRIDNKDAITFKLIIIDGQDQQDQTEHNMSKPRKQPVIVMPEFNHSKDLNNLVGLPRDEIGKLRQILSNSAMIYVSGVTVAEFFAIGPLAALTTAGAAGVAMTALALPFALIGIGAGIYGLSAILMNDETSSTQQNLESMQFASDPVMLSTRIAGDIIGLEREKSISYGKLFSSSKTVFGGKDLSIRKGKFDMLVNEYGRFEAVDTILGEIHLRQDECSGLDKQYIKP